MSAIAPSILIVMGVSGSGKSTVAALLAERLGWALLEGDALHPPANIEKMKHGIPLGDADRVPWLQAIEAAMDRWRGQGISGVLTCSALKRAYRDQLARSRPTVRFIYLKGDKDLIARRVALRRGHFMPPALLDSQFATLDEPEPDEPVVTIPIGPPPAQLVETILAALG
jgi:gluconokinase